MPRRPQTPRRQQPREPKVPKSSSFGGDISIGESKSKKVLTGVLVLSSILGILSAIFIFSLVFEINLPFDIFLELEQLAIISGICAFICGIYTIIEIIKNKKESI